MLRSEIDQRASVASTYSGYKICQPGDLVINKMQAWNGVLGVTGHHGIVSPDYTVLRPGSTWDVEYNAYLFRTTRYVSQFASLSKGIGFGFIRLYVDDFGLVLTLTPPKREQRAIAAFLDRETVKFNALVAKKEQLIELLQERRSALITHTVTKGLDPDVPMKDSGVEWLGKIPAHWDTTTLKYVAEKIVDCPHETPHYSPDGYYLVIRTSDLESGQLKLGHCLRVNEQEYLRRVRRETLKPGDIVYGREGERWGHAAIVPAHISLCLGQRMMQLRMKRMSNSKYYMWHLNASSIYQQGSVDIFGATSPHVNVVTIRNYWLVEPPQNEQHAIAALLDRETAKIDALIAKVREAIERLKELRIALISAAVTGKIDVREAAA